MRGVSLVYFHPLAQHDDFFQVTNLLFILIAAGLVINSVGVFNETGVLPSLRAEVRNTSPILSNDSRVGKLLKALVGYQAVPSLAQFMAYFGYFTLVWFGFKKSCSASPAAQRR